MASLPRGLTLLAAIAGAGPAHVLPRAIEAARARLRANGVEVGL